MSAAPARRRVSFVTMLLALVVVAITIGLAYRGWEYYLLDQEERVVHPANKLLRSHSDHTTGGLAYGWVAALLIVLNLSYLLRRRFGGFGKMQTWLDIHVFTGLTAASLVSFHSAFQLRTPVATLSTASLGLVVVTGLVGRFLFALAPGGARERLRDALDALDREWPGNRDKLAEAIAQRPGPDVSPNASLLRSLWAIRAWRRAGRDRREIIDLLVPPRAEQPKPMRRAIVEVRAAASADARAAGTTALLRSWRGLHRLFALLMLAAVFLHAGVAWYIGYRWIFG